MTSQQKLLRGAWAYTAAVAAELLAQDFPVDGVTVVNTVSEGDGASEAEAFVSLPAPWWTRAYPGYESPSLDWDAASGWTLRADQDTGTTAYWMGEGLTPEPAKVAMFLTAARVNGQVGSTDRPYYRRPKQDDPAPLTDRLLAYEDVLRRSDPLIKSSTSGWQRPLRHVFSTLLSTEHARMIDGHLTGWPEVRTVPLRAGEIQALTQLLEASDTADGNDLAADLRARYDAAAQEPADRTIPAQHSTALTRATLRKAKRQPGQ
ncbi:hypothetical protein [Kitasatospora sp. NPDC001547]|uniref:hypothetical protein n=1 Tax=Kitasatospora sp. NPDC001547 TaxID=3364015 RepID=UPI0036D0BFBB